MTHRKWEPGTLYAKAMRDITNEHNDTVDAWQAAEAEAERLGRANSDLCDQIAAIRAAVRVPFTDAQIERMADAFWKDYRGGTDSARCIRAALAAGGLEPCAVPEYDPADVALRPSERSLRAKLADAEAKIERQRKNLSQLYTANTALRQERDHKDKGWNYALKQWEKVLGELNDAKKQPAGWELDVTADDAAKAYCAGGLAGVIDFCRASIKPAYECKECDQWRKDWDTQAKAYEMLSKAYNAASKQLNAARAALEGDE